MKHLVLILILSVLAFTGCATTATMKVALARAATDVTVTGLIDAQVLSCDDVIDIVETLRDALGRLENVPEYTAAVYAATAPYVGGKLLNRLLLKTLPKYAFKLELYSYGLGQALNQAELAAVEYPNAKGSSP